MCVYCRSDCVFRRDSPSHSDLRSFEPPTLSHLLLIFLDFSPPPPSPPPPASSNPPLHSRLSNGCLLIANLCRIRTLINKYHCWFARYYRICISFCVCVFCVDVRLCVSGDVGSSDEGTKICSNTIIGPISRPISWCGLLLGSRGVSVRVVERAFFIKIFFLLFMFIFYIFSAS